MSGYQATNYFPAPQFPEWVVKKIGEPLLLEKDWNFAAFPNVKYGLFASSTGTISKDTANLLWGGAASIKMLTAAAGGDAAEVKTSIAPLLRNGELLAFEQKWASLAANNAGTQFHVGLEARSDTQIKHARFRWNRTLGQWQIENSDTTFSNFNTKFSGFPNAVIDEPSISAAVGDVPGWCRLVIDPVNLLYVSFECPIKQGGQTNLFVYDLRPLNLPLVVEGVSSVSIYTIFVLVSAGAAAADALFTTDWCVSKIPPGVSPF